MNKFINGILGLLMISIYSVAHCAPDPASYFRMTVQTSMAGVSNPNQFRIPTLGGQGYEYSVDCDSNGSFEAINRVGDYTCTYLSPGTYQVSILGDVNNGIQGFPQIYFANAGDKLKVLSIDQWGISEWSSMAGAFWGATNMQVNATDIPNFQGLNNLKLMFNGATSANPNTSNWNVSKVTDMTAMFQGATSANPDVSNWDTGNVQFMNFMFAGATIAEPDMSQWDIGKIVDMTGMFNIVSLQKSTYDAALKNFSSQPVKPNVSFHGGNSQYCAIAQHLNLSNPSTNNWTITDNGASTGCNSIDDFVTAWTPINDGVITVPTFGTGYYYRVDWNNDGDLNDTDESNIYTGDATHTYATNTYQRIVIKGVFPRIYIANGSERLKLRDIWQWGTMKWQSMENAFRGAENLFALPASSVPDLSQTTNLSHMFADATSVVLGLTNAFSPWDTSNIISMNSMFRNTTSSPEISTWDTSNVEDMSYMFAGAIDANPDTSLWDTSKVTDMIGMFQGAVSANPDTGLWDTSNVLRMDFMFDGAINALPDTSNWDTSLVRSMDFMFRNVPFANPDTRNWDIGGARFIAVTGLLNRYGFGGMFEGVKLNTLTYNSLLDKFSETASFSDLKLDGGNSNYCNESSQSRDDLSINYNWTITDAGGVQCGADSSLDDFVIVVKTNNPGSSSSTQFTIPVQQDLLNPHNYFVSCRDNGALNGGSDASGGFTCNYTTPGIYRIRIIDASGNGTGLPNIYFNNSGDRLKILDIRQWGTGKWQSMFSAFWGAANMIVTARDTPDLSQVSSLENMFRGARRANPDTKSWNVSNIRFMRRMFAGDYVANPDTSIWNTVKVETMDYMFYQAYNAKPDMSGWNIGQVTTMFQMFNGVTLPIPIYDAALINFDSQTHNPNIGFTAGNSMYCDGLTAKANLIGDGWSITDSGQECTPDIPPPPIQVSNLNDNTPLVRFTCSEAGNVANIYLTGNAQSQYQYTLVASFPCVGASLYSFEINTAIDDGGFIMQETESRNGDESLPSSDAFANLIIDTMTPDPSSIALSPNPAANGTQVFLGLTGLEWQASVSVPGMVCTPPRVDQTGVADCSGVVGDNGLDGTNNTITIIDANANTNTNNSTGLIVDNDAPDAPMVNSINEIDISITGTAEVDSVITLTGASCSNNPVTTNNAGTWNCTTSGLVAGNVVTATATDGVGNVSTASSPVIISGSDNTPPDSPTISPVNDFITVLSGTAEVASSITITGASCTNAPIITDINGDWSCNLPSTLMAGTIITLTATDAANNTSPATMVIVSTSNAFIFASGFED